MPVVSVITALFNKGQYVEETIRSVQAQTFRDWEMIVVDNGSTDQGPAQVREFAANDQRVRLVSSARHGPGTARNVGLGQARGAWIQFLDADDLLEPAQLAGQLAAAARQPEAEIIAGCWQEFPEQTPSEHTTKRSAAHDQSAAGLCDYAIAFTPWAVHAAIIRRSALTADCLWPERLDHLLAEDTAFWFKLVSRCRVACSECAGALYRVQTTNCRTQNRDAAKWFEGVHAAVEANLAWLAAQGQSPTAGQLEYLVRVYAELYWQALRQPAPETVARASERARHWLHEWGRLACWSPWPLVAARVLGLRTFMTLQHLRLRLRHLNKPTV